MITPKDLSKVWDAPDNSTLTKKQFSLRLPILAAAKIGAICDMYPRKSKNEIICDLLSTALEQFEEGLPAVKGQLIEEFPSGPDTITRQYDDIGPKARFRNLTIKYLRELEEEAGVKEPMVYHPSVIEEEEYH